VVGVVIPAPKVCPTIATTTTTAATATTTGGKRRARARAREWSGGGRGWYYTMGADTGCFCCLPEARRVVAELEAALVPNVSSSRSRLLWLSCKERKGLAHFRYISSWSYVLFKPYRLLRTRYNFNWSYFSRRLWSSTYDSSR
jgi:hypothetical protein